MEEINDNRSLKKWKILNDSDNRSKFVLTLMYNNVLYVSSLYKIRDEYKVIYTNKYDGIENHNSPEKIGEICYDMYNETINRIKNYDTFLDMMENIKHVEFNNEDDNV